MKSLELFAQIAKIDEARHEVWGVATAEVVDKEGEIFDYSSSKPYFARWSDEIAKATEGKSLGNVREMHAPSAVGKLVAIDFDDDLKQIRVGARIVDHAAWQKCTAGVYTGFSIGGTYVKTWKDGESLRFTANPVEISVVDNPCVPGAHFTAVKADGTCEVRKFSSADRAAKIPGVPRPGARTGEQSKMLDANDKAQLEKAHANSASALAKLAEVEQEVAGLRSEMESNNREIQQSLSNLLSLVEKLVSPRESGARVARAGLPAHTVTKEDDSRPALAKSAGGSSVHELLKRTLQQPQPASSYLR